MSQSFTVDTTAEQVGATLAEHIKGKNVIITGASPNSLGAESARVIAKYAALVVLAGRNAEKLAKTIDDVKKETPNANLRILILDLNSLQAVRKAAAEVNSYSEPIHVLINNAAIMASPYGTTEDGLESQIGTNHFAHFLFTALIFPRIVAASSPSDPARVVNVSSRGHRISDFRFDDYGFSEGKTYDPWQSYGQSKTANILFANELARRSKEKGVNVLAYSLHPGVISTNLGLHVSNEEFEKLGLKDANGNWSVPVKTLESGSATHLVAAFDPSIKDQTGAYLSDSQIAEDQREKHAASQESGEKLWDLSENVVKQKFTI